MWTKYTNNNEVVIEFSRRHSHEHYTLRMFVRLFMWSYKEARKSRQRVVRIQPLLWEDALHGKEQSWFKDFCYTELTNKYCWLRKGCKQRIIANKQLLLYTTSYKQWTQKIVRKIKNLIKTKQQFIFILNVFKKLEM